MSIGKEIACREDILVVDGLTVTDVDIAEEVILFISPCLEAPLECVQGVEMALNYCPIKIDIVCIDSMIKVEINASGSA